MQSADKAESHRKGGLRNLLLTCRDASRLQSEALDIELSVGKRIGLWLHLAICKWCRRYGRHIRFLRSAAQESAEPAHLCGPQSLSPEARQRIKDRLRAG